MSDAPRNTSEAAAFLKRQHVIESHSWKSLCQKLQREARGLPAVYPSALSASRATPASERVHKIADLRRGMVAFSDHPSDSNPYGHVYFIAGWKNDKVRTDASTCMTWSNLSDGSVGMVPLSYYLASWGDPFQFGATWLNGYNFSEFDKPPVVEPERAKLSDNFAIAIEDVEKELDRAIARGLPGLARALRRDVKEMRQTAARFN